MKPINLENNENNIPTSSNCVILESLGIDCSIIEDNDLGATLTNALEQMIYFYDTLKIDTYKTKCFGDDCSPKTFEEVFQMVMDAVSALAPEEVVIVCNSCIIETDPCISEDVDFTMEISEYVDEIVTRFCRLQGIVFFSLDRRLDTNEVRISALENADFIEIPFQPVEAICSLNPQTTDIVTLTKAFEKMFCVFSEFHGDPETIKLQLQGLVCEILPSGQTSAFPNDSNYASTITRLWEATCILRTELIALKDNCCGAGGPIEGCAGEDFVIDFSRDGSQIDLGVTGSLTSGYMEGSSFVTVTDVNNDVYTENVIVNNYSGSTITINVPNTLDVSDTLVVDIEIITLNISLGGIPCSSIYTETLYNVLCATISGEIVSSESIAFSLSYSANVSTDYVIELTDGITTFTENVNMSVPSTVPVIFDNLIPETEYTLTLTTLAPNNDVVVCAENQYTTQEPACDAALNLQIDGLV